MIELLLALVGIFGAGSLSSIPLGIRAAKVKSLEEQLVTMTTDRDKWSATAATLQKAVERQELQAEAAARDERLATTLLTGMRALIDEKR